VSSFRRGSSFSTFGIVMLEVVRECWALLLNDLTEDAELLGIVSALLVSIEGAASWTSQLHYRIEISGSPSVFSSN
jgi:hypothetical protein